MSFFAARDALRARDGSNRGNAPQSPSLASVSVLSTAAALSVGDEQTEWVLFSPRMRSGDPSDIDQLEDMGIEPFEPLESLDSGESLQHLDSLQSFQPLEATNPSAEDGFELPAHDGAGSFFDASLASSQMTMTVNEHFDRINMWRLDQSRLLFTELQKLERHLFPSGPPNNDGSPKEGLWRWLQRKSAQYLTLDDDVLDAIFSEDYQGRPKASDQEERNHFQQAKVLGPDNWDDDLVEGLMGSDLHVSSVLRRLIMLLPAHELRVHQASAALRHQLVVPSVESPLRNPYYARREGSYWWSDFDTTTSSISAY